MTGSAVRMLRPSEQCIVLLFSSPPGLVGVSIYYFVLDFFTHTVRGEKWEIGDNLRECTGNLDVHLPTPSTLSSRHHSTSTQYIPLMFFRVMVHIGAYIHECGRL